MNVPPLDLPGGACVCGRPIDHFHMLSGCGCGNERQCKHDGPKIEYLALGTSAGLVTVAESLQIPKMADINCKYVIDLQFNNFDNGRHLLAEVMITNSAQERAGLLRPGQSVYNGEQKKIRKYAAICSQTESTFRPLVIEDQGRMGDSTRITANDLIRHVLLRRTGLLNPMEDALTKRYWTARIIMAMHRSACLGVKSRATNIALARMRFAGILSPGSPSLRRRGWDLLRDAYVCLLRSYDCLLFTYFYTYVDA